jgi:hypothetical protein
MEGTSLLIVFHAYLNKTESIRQYKFFIRQSDKWLGKLFFNYFYSHFSVHFFLPLPSSYSVLNDKTTFSVLLWFSVTKK